MRSKRKLQKYVVVLGVLICAGLGGTYLWYAEGEVPALTLTPQQERISPQTHISVDIRDAKSGLRSVQVLAVQDKKSKVLAEKQFSSPVHSWKGSMTLAGKGLTDGPVSLKVTARDRSWRNWLKGNLLTETKSFIFDSKPPRINLQSFRHNLHQGGSGVVAFEVSEPVTRAGVRIKDYFFPAYAQPNGMYLCFFSFPFNLEPSQGRLVITATDLAGNQNQAGFHHYVNDTRFAHVKLPITDNFLQTTIVDFKDRFPDQKSLLDVFLKVNRQLRQQNRDKLLEIGRQTSPTPLWSGRFLRQTGAARKANFGTHRTYVYRGKVIDEQTHLGVDLASVARAEVPAANSGRVVYADWLGIYGQVVIIDHGLGLQSLYAHLSQLNVHKGEEVKKGQIIGRTGNTGLAGGDHLHFAVLISGVPVNPVEWWDAQWIANNISPKLSLLQK